MKSEKDLFENKELFWKLIYGILMFFMTIALYFMAIPMRQDISDINVQLYHIRVKVDVLENNNRLLYNMLLAKKDNGDFGFIPGIVKE